MLGAPGGTALDTILPRQFANQLSSQLPALKPGEGELAVLDRAFGTNSALLVRDDPTGSSTLSSLAQIPSEPQV